MTEPLFVDELQAAAPVTARPLTRAGLRPLLVVLPFLVLASYGLFDPQLLGYHHYRQSHDAIVARNFATGSASPLQPMVDGVTWGKALYLNDFPLYPWLVGMVWRWTGESLGVARALSLLFGLGALWSFRALLRRLTADPRLADLATVVLGLMPVSAWFLRTVQRQSLFVFLLVLALERLVAWVDEGRRSRLVAGASAFAAAVLLNPFAVYAAIPVADRLARRRGARALVGREVLVAAAAVVLPSALWYGHVLLVAPTLPTKDLVAITAPVAHRDFLNLSRYAFWLDPSRTWAVVRTTAQFVLPFASSLAVLGVGLLTSRRTRGARFLGVWLAAVLAYFVVDYYPIAAMVHQYYYLNVAPPLAAFAAAGFLALRRWAGEGGGVRRAVVLVAALAFLAGSIKYTRRMVENAWHREYYAIGERIEREVPSGARVQVVTTTDDPLLSWILGDEVAHRATVYTPEVLEALLARPDFDYLAVVHDVGAPPPWPALHRVRREGLLEIATAEGLDLFRMPPLGRREAP